MSERNVVILEKELSHNGVALVGFIYILEKSSSSSFTSRKLTLFQLAKETVVQMATQIISLVRSDN